MEEKNTIITLFSILVVAAFFVGMLVSGGSSIEYVNNTVITEKLVNQTCPGVVIDDYKTDKIFESEFATEINEIEDEAYLFALEELEDDSYEVIEDYFRTLENYKEDSIDVDVEDFEVEVTMLGLEDDEDKAAIVTFDLDVDYRLDEGIKSKFTKGITAVYSVTFDEGDFSDEKVKLISLA